ncbi:MAG: hypothetical protein ISR64_05740 [Deltaproteobacteria bacterium]|nr:hypothetical protein [Deltaproteobacteria bacterium]
MKRSGDASGRAVGMRGPARICVTVLAIGALGLAGCGKGTSSLDEWKTALVACDYGDACIRATRAVRSMTPDQGKTTGGYEVRALALKAGIQALAAFPPGMDGFLDKIGLDRGQAIAALKADAKALSAAPEWAGHTSGALSLLDFLASPSCEGFAAVEAVGTSGGFFSDSAALVGIGALAQLFASAEPVMAHMFGKVARSLVGCTLTDRASTGAVLVEARNRLLDRVDDCTRNRPADAAFRSSCKEAGALLESRSLALPMPDVGAGDLLGAMLPRSFRGVGVNLTPPWSLVLTAGRLGIWDQPVMGPGVRKSEATIVSPMMDLRKPHVSDSAFYVVREAIKARKVHKLGKVPICALVVDQSTTVKELFEVLEAILAASDAIPLVATTAVGRSVPTFVPINYRVTRRIMLDSTGARTQFGTKPAIEATLSSFVAGFDLGGQKRTAELGKAFSGQERDLRAAYRAAMELEAQNPGSSMHLVVRPAVPVELLLEFLQALAVRIPEPNLETARHFRSARPLRRSDGGFDYLIPVTVVASAD